MKNIFIAGSVTAIVVTPRADERVVSDRYVKSPKSPDPSDFLYELFFISFSYLLFLFLHFGDIQVHLLESLSYRFLYTRSFGGDLTFPSAKVEEKAERVIDINNRIIFSI